jgi:hypothetical protein
MQANTAHNWRGRVAVAGAALLAAAAHAAGLPDCPVAPFADVSAAQRAVVMNDGCQYESSRWQLETPRAKPLDPGPSLVKAQFSSLMSMRFPSLVGSLKFDWAGMRLGDADGGLRTERTAVALGGLLRLVDSLSLQTNLGLEHTGAPRNRATIASIWQPSKTGLLFAEWAGSDTRTEARRVGGRWWLVPRRFSIDLGARHVPDGPGWVDQRIGLALNLPL